MQSDSSAQGNPGISEESLLKFAKRNIIRGVKFTVAGGAGFFIAEGLIATGILIAGLPYILEINIVAAVLSIAGGFFINEYWTSKNEGDHSGNILGIFARLFKFELVYALGNAISIAVQLYLFHTFNIYPLIGNIAGAAVALPVNYFVSMLVVWRIKL